MISPDGTTMMSGNSTSVNSGYTGILYENGTYTSYTGITYPANKYYDKYSFGTLSTQIIRSKLGDGIKEVSSTGDAGWYGSKNLVVRETWSWARRGGSFEDNMKAGILSSDNTTGFSNSIGSSRFIIVQ